MTEEPGDPEYALGIAQAEEMFDSLLLEGLSQRAALCVVSEAMPDWPWLALVWELVGIGRDYRHTEGEARGGMGIDNLIK